VSAFDVSSLDSREASDSMARSKRPRIAVADDDPTSLDQTCRLVGTRFNVVAKALNGRELVETVRMFSPDVVIADITMPEMNGIEATRQIKQIFPTVNVVMLSVHADPTYIEEAFEAGASGYVLKLGASKELIVAIEDVLAGRHYRPAGF
jgi:DNA-binding NarL/FixJ family response regulator